MSLIHISAVELDRYPKYLLLAIALFVKRSSKCSTSSTIMCRKHRKPVKGGRIVKPPRAPERFVRADVDLRHGIGSVGAQSHVQEQSGGASANTQASTASSGNGQIARPVQLPDIDEVPDVRRLDQHLYDRYSTRILMQNELHRARHFSARCHRIINDGAKRTVPFGKMTSNMDELCRQVDSTRLRCALDYTYILGKTRLFDMWRTVEGAGNLQRYFRTIDIGVERELLRRVRTGTFCTRWGCELPEELRSVPRFSFPSALEIAKQGNLELEKRTAVTASMHEQSKLAIASVPSSAIAGSSAKAVPLMPLAYAEDVRRINKELDEEENGPKPRKPTSMERLQARRVMAHDKGNYQEVEQIEKSITWKQSVRSAARKRRNARKRALKEYVACKEKGPWRKRDPPSDEEHGECARPARGAASAASAT